MHAIILGAGIIGLSTAYALRQQGYQVTIIDQEKEVGQGASFANGAQLSYSYVAPLAGPGVISKLPSWLLNPQSPLRFKPRLALSDLCWNVRFILACQKKRSQQTTQELLELANMSRSEYGSLFELESFKDIDFSATGKLVVHRSAQSLESAIQQLSLQEALGGMPQKALTREECIKQEPALAPIASQLEGGIFTPSEQAADSYKVALAFKHYLKENGVTFLLNTKISALQPRQDNHRLVGVKLENQETLFADKIIMCLGAQSTHLLANLGIKVPVAPLKGYSLTLDILNDTMAPRVSVTDFDRKVVYARLGNRLRLAGMADFVGLDYRLDHSRLQTLIQEAKAMFAQAGDYDSAKPWTGLRPATPLGKPIIDKTCFDNLYLNIGHGALGFTLAPASATLLAHLVDQKEHPLLKSFQLTSA